MRFATHYAALLLRARGYVLKRGDAARMLRAWLELPDDALPSERLWRSLMHVE